MTQMREIDTFQELEYVLGKKLTTRNLIKFIIESIFFSLSRKLKKICEMRDESQVAQWHSQETRKTSNIMAGWKPIVETIKNKIPTG